VDAITKKIQKIGFHSKIRVLYFGKKKQFRRHWRVVMLKGIFQQFTNQGLNEFSLDPHVTPDDEYFWLKWSYDRRLRHLLEAYKKRDFAMGATPFVLNTEELATLYHFPTIEIKAPMVKKTEARRAEPPVGLPIALDDEEFLTRPVKQKEKQELEAFNNQESPQPIIPQMPEELLPIHLPAIEEGEKKIDLNVFPDISSSKEFSSEEVRKISLPSPMKVRKIPDAIRVLIEPGVELEDVHLVEPPQEDVPHD
jgi:hypothetical protein